METLLVAVFIIGYLAITLEHTLRVDKLIPALAMMSILWSIIALYHIPVFQVDTNLKTLVPLHLEEILLHHLGKTAEIVVFLLGAMTIVEIIDYFNGFLTIKKFIRTKSKKKLLWIFAILAFILSAIIDKFKGGPVGLTTIATAVGEQAGTIEEVYEPFLIKEGYLMRTPRGRQATDLAFKHLGRIKESNQGNLF